MSGRKGRLRKVRRVKSIPRNHRPKVRGGRGWLDTIRRAVQ
jgi:hypothetical protein